MQALASALGWWTRREVPDLRGRTAVVTGVNSGIGFEVARALVDRGASLIGVARNEALGREAVEDLREEFPDADVSLRVCNLELVSEARALAEALVADGKSINLLINCAGRFLDEAFSTTKEGVEHTLAVDYFGPVALTLGLLPAMLTNGPGRIVNVCSEAEMFGSLDWDDPRGVKLGTSGIAAYGRAKLQLLLFSLELQRRLRLAGAQVECFAVHPGLVATALFNKAPFLLWTWLAARVFGQSPLQGAQSTIYAATAPQLRGKGGSFIGPSYATNLFHTTPRHPVNPRAYDVDAWRELWDTTLAQLQQLTGRELPSLPAVATRV